MKPVALFWRGFDLLLNLLAVIAAAMIAAMFLAIIYDVVSRNLRIGTITWVVAMTEYGLLYVTALGTPWLLRERGHVAMEALRSMLPAALTVWLEKLVLLLCVAACLAAAWLAIPVIERNIGMTDARARFIPRWTMFAPILLAFALCAVQFLRFLLRPGSFFDGGVRPQDGI
jgi:C4-dicarboxylate transporter DctQ subunit